MILAGVGLSTASTTKLAAKEAAEHAVASLDDRRADFAIVFATAEHGEALPDLLGAIADAASTPYVAGCSAAGVLVGQREIEDGPAIGVLAVRSDAIRATPFLFQDTGDAGLTAGLHAGQRLLSSKDTNDVVLVWPDPHAIRPDRLLSGLDATLGPVPVAGGAASSAYPGGATFSSAAPKRARRASRACASAGRFGTSSPSPRAAARSARRCGSRVRTRISCSKSTASRRTRRCAPQLRLGFSPIPIRR